MHFITFSYRFAEQVLNGKFETKKELGELAFKKMSRGGSVEQVLQIYQLLVIVPDTGFAPFRRRSVPAGDRDPGRGAANSRSTRGNRHGIRTEKGLS